MLQRLRSVIFSSLPITTSLFVEMTMHSTLPVCSVTDPICLCVVASQNETDESEETVMNAPSFATAMRLYLSPWTDH